MGLRLRLEEGHHLFFVTTTVVDFIKIFTSDEYCQILIQNLDFYRQIYNFKIIAYVIMPNHIHLILWPQESRDLPKIMRDFKKYTSVEVRRLLENEKNSRILYLLRRSARGYKNQKYKLWMDRYDRLAIYSAQVLSQKMEYIHYNPVRARLVKQGIDWKYSSARNYCLDDHSILKVDNDIVSF